LFFYIAVYSVFDFQSEETMQRILILLILAPLSASIALALSEPSNLYCFGASSFGQLGFKLSGLPDQFVALPVAPNSLKFSVLSAGDGYTCGVTKEFGISLAGIIYCWGAGSGGQLGYGGTEDQFVPIRSFLLNDNASFIGSPTPINGGFGFFSKGFTLSASKYGGGSTSDSGQVYGGVSIGGVHTCAISSSGILYCWGERTSFSGRTSSSIVTVPEKIDIPRTINASRIISTPSSGSGGGVTTETWRTSVTPTSFISVSTGGGFTCAVMEVMTNSTVELVDSVATTSGRRQLQNVTETSTPLPSPTPSISPSVSITRTTSPSPSPSRPFAPNGICFGKRNPIGGSSNGPVLVSTRTVFASISSGLNHACGVSITGSVSCWGSGKYGQLGNGTFEDLNNGEPVQVSLPAAAFSVACGDTFTCSLLTTFRIYCWGSNYNGRLGTGSVSDANFSTPQKIGGINYNWEFLTVGVTHSCASSNYYTFCWGEMRNGQQGNVRDVVFPTIKAQRDPLYMVPMQTDVNTGITVSSTYYDTLSSKYVTQYQQDTQKIYGSTGGGTSAGATHTCLLPSDYTSIGTAWCIGEGAKGALGFANSNTLTTSISSILGPIAKPIVETKPSSTMTSSWSLGSGASSFNSGGKILTVGKDASACVLRGDSNIAECFGSRVEGVLGDGYSTGTISSPSPSVGGMSFSEISLGKSHGCGIELSNSSLYCWGSLANSSTPILVSNAYWTSISSGDNFVCGIQSNGKGYCLGTDPLNTGRLGVDVSSSTVQGTWNNLYELNPSQWLSNSVPWQTISVGSSHACGIANSTAYCWGENTFGQLGNGVTSTQVGFATVKGGRLWSSIAVGTAHTCALDSTEGAVYCFGSNERGQIGFIASSDIYSRPTRVPGSAIMGSEILPQGDLWLSVTAGDFHSCLLSQKGRLVCFGDNSDGQLGSKAPSFREPASTETVQAALSLGLSNSSFISAPAEVLALSAFGAAGAQWKAVSAGGKKTCALLTMISASPSATPSPSPSPTQTPTVSGTPSTTPIIPSKSPTPSVTPSRSFTSTTSAIPAGVSRSKTPTSSVTPSESPVASPPPTPFFKADIRIDGITSSLATNSSVQTVLLLTVSTLMNVDVSKVKISSIIDNSTGTPVVLFSSRRLAYKTRPERQLQGASSSIIFNINVITGTASSGGSSSSSTTSASKAALLTSYFDGTTPLPASAQTTLGGSNPLSMLSSVSGVPISTLSAIIVPNSVVVEPVYVPHIYPTRTSTPTPTGTQTPVITNLVGTIVASSKGTALSSFQIAGFVAAGLAGVCFCAGFWLCVKLSIFDKCCCRGKKTEQVSTRTLAVNEFKGRGPIRIARRQPRKSDAIGNANTGGIVDNSDKIDGVSFNTVIVNPLYENDQRKDEEDEDHDEL